MSQSTSIIWVHAIIGTKYRMDIISPSIEKRIYKLIEIELRKKDASLRKLMEHKTIFTFYLLCLEPAVLQK